MTTRENTHKALSFAVAMGLLTGCLEPEGLPPLLDGPRTVAAHSAGEQKPVDALRPTDVAVLDGKVVVLDSHRGRLLVPGSEAAPLVDRPDLLEGATRLSPAEQGVWLTHPLGRFHRFVSDSSLAETVLLADKKLDTPCLPVAALEKGPVLRVACADGRLLDQPRDGSDAKLWARVPSTGPLGARLTDLVGLADGSVAAVDFHQPGVHLWNAAGEHQWSAGRHGLWVDAWSHPRALAAGPENSLLVVDRELSVVQIIDATNGTPLGALADGADLLRPQAPVAVRPGPSPDTWLVLQTEPAAVWTVTVDAAAIAAARATAATRALRHMLAEPRPAGDAETCSQCHDGLLTDGREVFDPTRHAHPVDRPVDPSHVSPDLPLGDDNTLRCTTCHSPHNDSTKSSFLREDDGPDALCVRCHTPDAHAEALRRSAAPGGVHPSGPTLLEALSESSSEATGCTSCHTPHGARGTPLLRHSDDDTTCVACHTDQGHSARNHPAPDATADTPAGCRSCHDLVGGHGDALVRAPTPDDHGCATCHEATATRLTDGHAPLHKGLLDGCDTCHDVHGTRPSAHLLRSPKAPCTSCHDDIGTHGLHRGTGAPTCTDCHDAHGPSAGVPECTTCHDDIAAVHAQNTRNHGTLACADCHPVHTKGLAATADATCTHCHHNAGSKAPQVPALDHPPLHEDDSFGRWDALADLTLFSPSGRPAAADAGGQLTCRSCHWTHGAPAGQGHDLMRPGLGPACAACHGEDALGLLRSYHTRRGSPP